MSAIAEAAAEAGLTLVPNGVLPVFAVSVDEAGRVLDLTHDAAWRLVRAGILPSVYVGRGNGRRVVLVEDIKAYLARQAADHKT